MYIFRIELRSFLFGWNALVAQCNRKWPLRSITFLFRNICKTADLGEKPLRKLCVLCASAVNFSFELSFTAEAQRTQSLRKEISLALDIIHPAIIITVFYVTTFNAIRLFS